MAKPKKTDIELEDSTTDVSKNTLGALLNGYKEDHYNFVEAKEYVISTGSLMLDSLIKIRGGDVIRLAGPSESGKSSQAILLLNNYLETVPKSKGFYVKAEGRFGHEMQKRSKAKIVFNAEEWDEGTIFVLESNVAESVFQMIEALFKTMYDKGQHLGIIVDSLDGLILKNDLTTKSIAENQMVGGLPKITKLMFRRLGLPINKYNGLLVAISQYSTAIKIDSYAKDAPRIVNSSGGNSANHSASVIWEYGQRYHGDLILEDEDAKPDPVKNKIVGHYVRINILKSSTDVSGTNVKLAIKRGRPYNSFWTEKEIGDLIMAWGLAKKGGAWITFDSGFIEEAKQHGLEIKEKIQGLPKLYVYLEENPLITEWLKGRFKEIFA